MGVCDLGGGEVFFEIEVMCNCGWCGWWVGIRCSVMIVLRSWWHAPFQSSHACSEQRILSCVGWWSWSGVGGVVGGGRKVGVLVGGDGAADVVVGGDGGIGVVVGGDGVVGVVRLTVFVVMVYGLIGGWVPCGW